MKPIIDRWTVTSLIAGTVGMATVALVISWPAWRGTWILIAGEAVFVWMMLRHPEHWYRRTATFMLTAAIALALPPMIRAQADIHGVGKVSMILDSQPWLSVALVAGALILVLIDLRSRQHAQAEQKTAGPLPKESPAQPWQPVAQPDFTGVVEAYVDGTVWRARMRVGEVVEVKPFCPRHGVPLKPKQNLEPNWYCTTAACDYYRLMPNLSSFDLKDRIALLRGVHAEIQRRVKEGTAYTMCADDPSSQI